MTLDEAREALGKSVRTMHLYAEQKKIRTKMEKNPNSGHENRLFHAGDVARLQHLRDHPEEAAGEEGASNAVALARSAPSVAGLAGLLKLLPAQTAPEKPWLTLEEAAAYAGLTKSWLKAQAEATIDGGKSILAIRDMGKFAPGGRWRFGRESLRRE